MEQPGPHRSAFGVCLPFYNKEPAFGLAFSHGELELLALEEMELMTQVRAGEVFPEETSGGWELGPSTAVCRAGSSCPVLPILLRVLNTPSLSR